MADSYASTGQAHTVPVSLWRDVVGVVAITACCGALAAYADLNERIFLVTRGHESLQLDELPVILLVLALGLIWLSWRRTRELLTQLHARQAAEAALECALVENRQFGHERLRVEEAERQHLARELHDELGQYLNAIKIDAVGLRDARDTNPQSHRSAGDRIIRSCDHVHGVVSDIIRRLRPAGLDELGLVAAIENCVDHWRVRSPETQFAFTVCGDLESLGETLNLTLYRLVQEGLTNSQKHAQAQRVEIALERHGTMPDSIAEVVLRVSDDGRGRGVGPAACGFGLRGMRERIEMLGGRIALRAENDRGFGFEAHIPFTA